MGKKRNSGRRRKGSNLPGQVFGELGRRATSGAVSAPLSNIEGTEKLPTKTALMAGTYDKTGGGAETLYVSPPSTATLERSLLAGTHQDIIRSQFGRPAPKKRIFGMDDVIDLEAMGAGRGVVPKFETIPKSVAEMMEKADYLDPSGNASKIVYQSYKDSLREGYSAGMEDVAKLRQAGMTDGEILQQMRGPLMRRVEELEASAKDKRREIDVTKKHENRQRRMIDAWDEFHKWFGTAESDEDLNMVIDPISDSFWHKAVTDPIMCSSSMLDHPEMIIALPGFLREDSKPNVFLVQHRWSHLIQGTEIEGEWRLPYDECCFEFLLAGKRFCLYVNAIEGEPKGAMLLAQNRAAWLVVGVVGYIGDPVYTFKGIDGGTRDPLTEVLLGEARAISIMLDSEVLEHEVVRAPADQNRQRAKRGNPLIRDHHILSVAKRHRAARRPDAEPTGRKVRLHFRRGHWRRYETHKTWIKWQLVGNADLGFVGKEYSA